MAKMTLGTLVLSAVLLSSGCGSSDFSKAEQTINSSLKKDPSCLHVGVEVPVDKSKVLPGGSIQVLQAKGLIDEGPVKKYGIFGDVKDVPGYVFTATGKELVVVQAKNGYSPEFPCVKVGIYEVVKIEALDFGYDAEGKSVVNVRTSIKFIPESWVADTKLSPAWEKFWTGVKQTESTQLLYSLVKSGDQFFFNGKPKAVK